MRFEFLGFKRNLFVRLSDLSAYVQQVCTLIQH